MSTSDMTRKERELVLKKVWVADDTKRYRPLSYNGGVGWGVYDTLMGCYVDGDLDRIDPDEPLIKN